MRLKLTSAALAAATAAVLLPAAAIATHETQIAPDVTKLDYAPNGHFAQGTPLPPHPQGLPARAGGARDARRAVRALSLIHI